MCNFKVETRLLETDKPALQNSNIQRMKQFNILTVYQKIIYHVALTFVIRTSKTFGDRRNLKNRATEAGHENRCIQISSLDTNAREQ